MAFDIFMTSLYSDPENPQNVREKLDSILSFYITPRSFFFGFGKKRKLDLFKLSLHFFFLSQFYSPHSYPDFPHFHTDSPHSHPYSLHSHPDSPHSSHSHQDSSHSQPYTRIPILIPRIPLIPFSDFPFRLLQFVDYDLIWCCINNQSLDDRSMIHFTAQTLTREKKYNKSFFKLVWPYIEANKDILIFVIH